MTSPLTVAPPAAVSNRWTGPIRVLAAVTSAVVLFFGAGSVIGFFMLHTRTETTSFSDPVTGVRVNSNTGNIIVRTGAAGSAVAVTSRAQSAFRTAEHTEAVTGGLLDVVGRCRGGLIIADDCSVDFEISVPPGTRVETRTSTGDITIRSGSTAAVTATSGTGDIRVYRAAGRLQLRTRVGDVIGTALLAPVVSGRSDTGDVRLEFGTPPRQLRAATQVGDVRVLVPDDATSYRVSGVVDVGDSHIDVLTDPNSANVVQLSSQTGDVRIGPKS